MWLSFSLTTLRPLYLRCLLCRKPVGTQEYVDTEHFWLIQNPSGCVPAIPHQQTCRHCLPSVAAQRCVHLTLRLSTLQMKSGSSERLSDFHGVAQIGLR